MSIKLFPMQEVAVQKGMEYFNSTHKKDDKPVIMVAPTAYGKSIIISELARRIGKVLVIQPSKELLEQNYSKLIALGGEASIFSASMGVKEIGDITYATIGSIKQLAVTFKQSGVKCVIIDECHNFVSSADGMFGGFIRELGVKKVIGLTATPFRLGNYSSMSGERFSQLNMLTSNKKGCGFFKDIIYCCQIHEIISAKRWSPLVYNHYDFVSTLLRVNSTGAEYTDKSVADAFKANDLAGKIKEHIARTPSRHILVFVPTVAAAYEMSNQIWGSMVVHGELPKKERDWVISNFRNGKCRVVINVNVLCLDTQTEILCKNGWVKHDEMTYDHLVANWKNGAIYYSNPYQIVSRPMDAYEAFVSLKSKEGNFRVTNHHDLICVKKGKMAAEDFVGKPIIVPTCGVADVDFIEVEQRENKITPRRIAANSYNIRKTEGLSIADSRAEAVRRIESQQHLIYKNPRDLTASECWLIGFWMGDGSRYKNKASGSEHITLCQSYAYPHIVQKIDRILSECDIVSSVSIASPDKKSTYESKRWSLPKGTGHGPQQKKGVYHLLPYFDKNGSDYLHGINREQLLALVEGFWYADGNHGGGEFLPRTFTIHKTNHKVLSLIQHLCVVRGIHCNLTTGSKRKEEFKEIYKLSINPHKTCVHLGSGNDKVVNEGFSDENVWCVGVESGNIITRRNGRVTVMGNCVGFDYPEIDEIILARPTMSLAWLYQAIGRGTRIHEGKEKCIISDFVGVTKKFGKIEDLVIEQRFGNTWEVWSGNTKLSSVPLEELGINESDVVTKGLQVGMVMPFGKHKDVPIVKLQTQFMAWMLENFGGWAAYGKLKEAFIEELTRRDKAF